MWPIEFYGDFMVFRLFGIFWGSYIECWKVSWGGDPDPLFFKVIWCRFACFPVFLGALVFL